tara:strand:- start:3442 stop:4026 length:585 start_codon:yes stop_codon:yes gene_type:complete
MTIHFGDSTTIDSAGGLGGISYADSWRVTSSFTMSSGTHIVSNNWERDDTNFQIIGTGLSHNGSGKFGFQETGKYLVQNNFSTYDTGGSISGLMGTKLFVSTNGINGSYNSVSSNPTGSMAYGSGRTRQGHGHGAGQKILDVTNTNTYFYFATQTTATYVDPWGENPPQTMYSRYLGSSSENIFSFFVVKLGGT